MASNCDAIGGDQREVVSLDMYHIKCVRQQSLHSKVPYFPFSSDAGSVKDPKACCFSLNSSAKEHRNQSKFDRAISLLISIPLCDQTLMI